MTHIKNKYQNLAVASSTPIFIMSNKIPVNEIPIPDDGMRKAQRETISSVSVPARPGYYCQRKNVNKRKFVEASRRASSH
jgi:hypothetical protein